MLTSRIQYVDWLRLGAVLAVVVFTPCCRSGAPSVVRPERGAK